MILAIIPTKSLENLKGNFDLQAHAPTILNVSDHTSSIPRLQNLQALIPAEFRVDVRPKPGGLALPKIPVLNAMTEVMAKLAMQSWEKALPNFITDPIAEIAMTFSSGSFTPFFQVNTICWSLAEVLTDFNERETWAEASWVSKMLPDTIGVGKIYLSKGLASNRSKRSTTLNQNLDAFADTQSAPAFDKISSPEIEAVLARSVASQSNAGTVQLRISYTKDGRTLPAELVYALVMLCILTAGPYESNDPAMALQRYDQAEDLTIAITPTKSQGLRQDAKWWMILEALWMLVKTMSEEGPGGKWAEVKAVVKFGGLYIAKLAVMHGRASMDQIDSIFDAEEGGNVAADGVINSRTTAI